MSASSPQPFTGRPRPRPLLLLLAYLAFISLGLPDAVLGLVWPSIREEFSLPLAALGGVLATAATAYFLSGLFAGRFMQALGIGLLLVVSTALVALGVSGYASSQAFGFFLVAACVVGLGSGAIDAALNTYAALHFGARHMSWLHAAYSAGAAVGPVLMTALLTRGAVWRTGYFVISATLGTLAVAFAVMRRQWGGRPAPAPAPAEAPASPPPGALGAWATLRQPVVRIQIAAFFLYTGLEVAAGQWSYTLLTESRGLTPAAAGTWTSVYWASIFVGRCVLGFVVEQVGTVRLMRLCLGTAAVGALLFALPGVPVGVGGLGLGLLGFSLAPIFPGLMSETPRRVGAGAETHAVGFQVSAATAGVAAIPSLAGLLAGRFGLEAVAVLVLVDAVVLAALHEKLIATADRRVAAS